jgi:hypothetical protein
LTARRLRQSQQQQSIVREKPQLGFQHGHHRSSNYGGHSLRAGFLTSTYPNGPSDSFDLVYMQQLFEYGYQRGRSGIWQRTPAQYQPPRRVMSEAQ